MDDSRRDDGFDRELRRALAADGGAASSPHVDAELAAAWMDRRLDAGAARAIEVHLADCADCQAVMATLARLTPEEPELAAVSWWRRMRAGWLVPATVAAAAGVVIWVALPQQRVTPPEAAPPASTLSTAAPAAERDAASQEFAQQTQEPERRTDNLARAARVARPATPAPAPEAENKRERAADTAAEQPLLDTRRADKATVTGEAPAIASERQASAVPPAPPRAVPQAPPPPEASVAQERSFLGGAASLRASITLTIVAPDGAAQWFRMGSVLRFAPRADATSTPATLPVAADLVVAGASPGGTICWLVGRGGLVLVTTDGVGFVRVTAPAPLDLRSVTPTDARTAIVTAVNGRRFRTTDQGASWTAVP